ncbi:MAG TPA: type II toxin-antitoxin system VapC family toxin [Leptospiraceae bacterium]|nr:type II toxin-antitoxin system VapC family toxin [Leptospiraceae bacterium]
MKYVLDTNVCINYLRGKSQLIADRLIKIPAANRIIPSIVKAELYHGAYKSTRPEENIKKVSDFLKLNSSLAFDDSAAQIFGRIRANLERKGITIGPYDLQIAAISIAHDCILVTHNTNEFSRIDELKIEDWEIL